MVHVVFYILEMLDTCLSNTDFARGDAEVFHQGNGIVVGSVGSTKTRHGDAYDVSARTREFVHRANAYEEGEGGIESTTDAENNGFGMGVNNTLAEGINLYGEDFLASLIEFLTCWNKWMWVHPARKFVRLFFVKRGV